MKQIKIDGEHTLSGTIKISGAKNSAVALIPAALLSDEVVAIDNVPNISDIKVLSETITYLGGEVTKDDGLIKISLENLQNKPIVKEYASKLRASYYFMGALLGKYKKVDIYFPGGCSIGARPINLHLKGFEALGAQVTENYDHYIIEAEELIGNHIYLDVASVGATINIMLAAVKAKGETIIENAAKEPEIVNIATFLNNMGANIKGAGTSEIRINGVDYLGSCFSEVIPDRIEAGTYVIAGALMGDNLRIENIIPEHIEALIIKLKEAGCNIKVYNDYLVVSKVDNLKAVDVKTLVYPGFPTDLQQPMTTFLTLCNGTSTVIETIYENRFQNVKYLNKMGANIHIKGDQIFINGKTPLHGSEVVATDLRAGACLVLAGLVAQGTTYIKEVDHILRGYENIIQKLSNVGAKIELTEI